MAVYVDDAFLEGNWGKWSGGGHLQADTEDELHEFAGRLGLKRSWFQSKTGRPEMDHYDLTKGMRQKALRMGAIEETVREAAGILKSGVERRKLAREARQRQTQT